MAKSTIFIPNRPRVISDKVGVKELHILQAERKEIGIRSVSGLAIFWHFSQHLCPFLLGGAFQLVYELGIVFYLIGSETISPDDGKVFSVYLSQLGKFD